jgi:hypothetical protein
MFQVVLQESLHLCNRERRRRRGGGTSDDGGKG